MMRPLQTSPFASSLPLNTQTPTTQSQIPEAPSPAPSSLNQGEQLSLQEAVRGNLPPEPLQLEVTAGKNNKVKGPKNKQPLKPGPKPNPRPNPNPNPTPDLKAGPKADSLPPKEPEPVKLDPDRGIEKPAKIKGSGRTPEKADEQIYEDYLGLQREVRDDLDKTGTSISDAERKDLLLSKLVLRLGREDFQQLPEAHKNNLLAFLNTFDFSELVAAEVQSEGGADAVEGIVTGTGVDGHYTNSILNSVQGLLSSQRLTPELLDAFKALQTASLHADLAPHRLTLLRSALQELAYPERIEQHSKGTCAATTVQIVLALKNPVQYLNILQNLASPEGKVPPALLHGATDLEREVETLKDDRSGRSLSSRLLQPAFMEFANGPAAQYDNTRDRNFNAKEEYPGLNEESTIRLSEALFGPGSYQLRYTHTDPDPTWKGFVKPAVLLDEIDKALSQGEPVPVGLRWGETAHKVLLVQWDKSNQQAYFMNPWGELQKMNLNTFTKRLDSASLPKSQPGSSRPALQNLFGAAAKLESYNPLSGWRYYKVTDYLVEDPHLQHLSAERKEMLRDKFRGFKLSPETASKQLDLLVGLTAAGLVDEKLFERIQAVRDKDELAALVNLYKSYEKLPADRFKTLVDAEPDKHLDAVYYQVLMDSLHEPETTEQLVAMAKEIQAAKRDGRFEANQQAQAKLKEDFIAIESGGSLDTLKQLAQTATEQTRLYMLLQVKDKWPFDQAEAATKAILEGLNMFQLSYVLQGLEPNVRYVGANSPDQLKSLMTRLVRSAAIQRR